MLMDTLCTDGTMLSDTQLLTQPSNKRKDTSSPRKSPHYLGKIGPKRKRTVDVRKFRDVVKHSPATSHKLSPNQTKTLSIAMFSEQPHERGEREKLQHIGLVYMITKQELSSQPDRQPMKELKDIVANPKKDLEVDSSSIYYMELLDENPDSDETVRHVAELLMQDAVSEYQHHYVLLVGDGKTYEHLRNIKRLYGPELHNLLIFPGDWHTLFNYQLVLMKIYYLAGLKEMAKSAGFKGETLTSLERCSNFKRTHSFLLQAWQAVYRVMLEAFKSNSNHLCPKEIDEAIQGAETSIDELNILADSLIGHPHTSEFLDFVTKQSNQDDTWQFWSQFIFEDCFAYVGLYIAIRTRNWELRMSCLKLMGPLFKAFDRTTYQQLIPNHLADIEQFPDMILDSLKRGGFAVNISGEQGHCVALDEAHEMCVNKDMKNAIVRPTTPYLQKTSLFLRFRITAYKNLLKQLFLTSDTDLSKNSSMYSMYNASPSAQEREENMGSIIELIKIKDLLPVTISQNRGIINTLSGLAATPEQKHDLLHFRRIGAEHLAQYINLRILKQPSTDAPVRKHRLVTMDTKRRTHKRTLVHERKGAQNN